MKLILASTSPRRVEILRFFKIVFIQKEPSFDESQILFKDNPSRYVKELAYRKASSITAATNEIVLGADTIVYRNHKIYGKPGGKKEALLMLKELSWKWHSVFTGLCIKKGRSYFCGVEETKVLFNKVTNKQIALYINGCHVLDKAGSYAVQRSGSILIKKVDGCFYNVMGLPVSLLCKLLLKVDVDLWEFL